MNSEHQIIAKSYRSGLLIKCGLFFTIGLILTAVILYLSAQQPLGPSYQQSFARLAHLKHEMLVKSITIYSILSLLIISGIIFVTVMYSHRVVGPLVGLRRVIRAIAAGDLTMAARLREKDAIISIADAINELRDSCRAKILSISWESDEIEKLLNSNPEDLGAELTKKALMIQKLCSKTEQG